MIQLQNRVIEELKKVPVGDSITIRELSDRLERKETINNFMKKFMLKVETEAEACVKKDKIDRKVVFVIVKDPAPLDNLKVERKTKTTKATGKKKVAKTTAKKTVEAKVEKEPALAEPAVEKDISIDAQWADFEKEVSTPTK